MKKANTHLQAHLQLFFIGRKVFMAAKELVSFQPEKNFKFFSPTLKEKIKTPDRKPTTMQTDNKINFTADRHDTAHGQTEGQPVTAP